MRRLAIVAVLSLLLLVAGGAALAIPSGASDHRGHSGPVSHQDLSRLRSATARFHSLRETAKSGRVDLHLCVDQMGQHFADPTTFSDGELRWLHPEAMVYSDDGRGHLHLVAVEWVSDTPGSVKGIPLHFNPAVNLWVLHAWVWEHNPAGTFADMNPRIGDCPA
jgi:hypothetical protein